MSFQTYTRPRHAAVSPAAKAVGPVTRAIRGLRPNEMPSWEIREAEMRRQEAADLLALRRRVAKAVAQGIDFLDATGGDPEAEPNLGSPEVKLPDVYAKTATGRKTAKLPSEVFAQGHGDDQEIDDDVEQEAGEEAEEVNEDGTDNENDEPSLCGLTVNPAFAQGLSFSDGEEDAGDAPEEENEHGGDIQDEPHDPEMGEPSLGSTHNDDQTHWGASDTRDREAGDDNGIADQAGENWLRWQAGGRVRMNRPDSRRGFLRGLAALPLIGGSVALIGSPSAVAAPPSTECVESYLAWLYTETRAVHDTLYDGHRAVIDGRQRLHIPMDNKGAQFHFGEHYKAPGWGPVGQAAIARAPLVLAAVGCEWGPW